MLEHWNVVILGSGKMDKCCNIEKYIDTEVKNTRKSKLNSKANFPLFHHSIIPSQAKAASINKLI
jgi:hypothetical protein